MRLCWKLLKMAPITNMLDFTNLFCRWIILPKIIHCFSRILFYNIFVLSGERSQQGRQWFRRRWWRWGWWEHERRWEWAQEARAAPNLHQAQRLCEQDKGWLVFFLNCFLFVSKKIRYKLWICNPLLFKVWWPINEEFIEKVKVLITWIFGLWSGLGHNMPCCVFAFFANWGPKVICSNEMVKHIIANPKLL